MNRYCWLTLNISVYNKGYNYTVAQNTKLNTWVELKSKKQFFFFLKVDLKFWIFFSTKFLTSWIRKWNFFVFAANNLQCQNPNSLKILRDLFHDNEIYCYSSQKKWKVCIRMASKSFRMEIFFQRSCFSRYSSSSSSV